MSHDWERLGPSGLRFFGAISASLSHELKNSLAIINENAGLMQDFLQLAAQGRPLDPERLASSLERIRRHVDTANGVIGSLNRFAHLTDEEKKRVDLREEAALALRLHKRPAGRAGVAFSLDGDGDAVTLTSMPFLLGEALHRVIHAAMDAGTGDVGVTVQGTDGGATVNFTGEFKDLAPPGGEDAEALFAAIGARVVVEPGSLVLLLDDIE